MRSAIRVRWSWGLVATLAAVSCASSSTQPPKEGSTAPSSQPSLDDFAPEAGDYAGYTIRRDCPNYRGPVIAVIGQGSEAPRMDSPAVRQRYKSAGWMVSSAHAVGIGRACARRRLAVVAFYSDPTDMASSAHKIGRWLAQEDVDLDIILFKSAVPVLQ